MSSGRPWRRRVLIPVLGSVIIIVAMSVAAGAVMYDSTGAAAMAGTTADRPFSTSSPFRTPVAPDEVVDPRSDEVIWPLVESGEVVAGLYEYGIPVWRATPGTARVPVRCDPPGDWGECPLERDGVPVPAEATPHSGSDGAMVVVDEADGLIYEFWQADRTDDGWVTSWGAVNELNGSGWGGASTGAGASRLAGVVRVDEIRDGRIDHALVMQANEVCREIFRAPALKTDGVSDDPNCVPEGARLRLDPSIDLDALEMTPGERTVARALQTYGAYVIDRTAVPLSISFELAPDATAQDPGEVYRSAGFAWDYFGMPGIPWEGLQLMEEPR